MCVESTRRARELRAYRAALNLYAGDRSPEDRYEAWAEARREEMRRLYLSSIVELATLYEGPGEFGLAVEALRRVMQSESAYERAYAGLMRLYALSGERQRALVQYERCRSPRGTAIRSRMSSRMSGEGAPPQDTGKYMPFFSSKNDIPHNFGSARIY